MLLGTFASNRNGTNKMKFDDFINAVDRTSHISVNEQVATLLKRVPENIYMNFNNALSAMPDDVREAYGAFIRSKYQPAPKHNGRKPVPASERRIHVTVTLPESLVARVPYPRSSFVERAILAALGE